jgi:hypothetical protein
MGIPQRCGSANGGRRRHAGEAEDAGAVVGEHHGVAAKLEDEEAAPDGSWRVLAPTGCSAAHGAEGKPATAARP